MSIRMIFIIEKGSGPHCHHVMLYRLVVTAIMRSMKPLALHFIVTRRQTWRTAAMDSLNRTRWMQVWLMVSIHLTWTYIALIRLLVATAGASFALWWMIARALWYLTVELSRGVWLEWTAAVCLILFYLDRTHLRFCAVIVWRAQRNLRDFTANKRITLSDVFTPLMCWSVDILSHHYLFSVPNISTIW